MFGSVPIVSGIYAAVFVLPAAGPDMVSYLDAHHHVEVALRVLLDDVAHIVRLARLLELATRHEILDFPYRTDRVAMGVGQPVRCGRHERACGQ